MMRLRSEQILLNCIIHPHQFELVPKESTELCDKACCFSLFYEEIQCLGSKDGRRSRQSIRMG